MTKVETVAHYFIISGLTEFDVLHAYFTDNFKPEYRLFVHDVVEVCHLINCDRCYDGEGSIPPRKKGFLELKYLYEDLLPELITVQRARKLILKD